VTGTGRAGRVRWPECINLKETGLGKVEMAKNMKITVPTIVSRILIHPSTPTDHMNRRTSALPFPLKNYEYIHVDAATIIDFCKLERELLFLDLHAVRRQESWQERHVLLSSRNDCKASFHVRVQVVILLEASTTFFDEQQMQLLNCNPEGQQ
jgi:hypothetical protein